VGDPSNLKPLTYLTTIPPESPVSTDDERSCLAGAPSLSPRQHQWMDITGKCMSLWQTRLIDPAVKGALFTDHKRPHYEVCG